MTLAELLIVVAIMVLLMGIALPMLKNGLQGRKIREASRQLNTYVQLATSLAAETGRPSGLLFEVRTLPENGLPYVTEVYLAETPLPYAGDTVAARVTVNYNPALYDPTVLATYPQLTLDAFSASFATLVRSGDQIRFDNRGQLYTITIDPNTNIVHFNSNPPAPSLAQIVLPPMNVNQPIRLPYQVYRQPEKSSSTPFQLASGAVIDLSFSGFGLLDELSFDNTINVTQNNPMVVDVAVQVASILVVFNPSGQVSRVVVNKVDYSGGTAVPVIVSDIPTETLHLLVGEIGGLLSYMDTNGNAIVVDDVSKVVVGDADVSNIENPESFWVSINHQSGRPTSAENGWSIDHPQFATIPIAVAREFAQSGKASGGG